MSSSSHSAVALMTAASLLLGPKAHAQTTASLATSADPSGASIPAAPVTPHVDPSLRGPRMLMWTGATTFAAAYLAAAIGATTAYDDPAATVSSRGFLWIPLAGPFMLTATQSGAGWDTLLALDGLAQIGGLTLFIYGLARKHAHPVHATTPPGPSLSFAPLAAPGGAGASVVGTF